MTPTRRTVLASVGSFAALSLMARIASAQVGTVYNEGGIAVDGTDVVAYFSQGRPVAGDPAITHVWKGVTWQFDSAANRDFFAADPTRYAPQYGGFCAFGLSKGFKVPVIPEAWKIVDGKLYLNNSAAVQERFEGNTEEYINHADLNWEIVKDTKPEDLKEPIIR